ncbi:MAG: branched-chain-amino-acid transaminase [Planctomycetota bacterium]|nr:branched-chain-amino-acid transaminase [Planctomycetota bacterium]
MSLCIYVDGKFHTKREDATVCVYDHGLLYGDGIFEGIRVYNGRVFKLDEHLTRLYESAKSIMLTIPLNASEMRSAVVETVKRTGLKEAYIRLVVTRGVGDLGLDPRKCSKPTVIIICDQIALYAKEKYEKGLRVVTCSTRRNRPDSLNSEIKSLNYLNNILAKIETFRVGAEEGIMLNDSGYVSEATADNIFVVKHGRLTTPPAFMGLLEGITRNTVIDIARGMGYKVLEMPLSINDVYAADECFLTGTGAELIPVIESDGRQIGDGKPGPNFLRMLERYREITRTEGVSVYS